MTEIRALEKNILAGGLWIEDSGDFDRICRLLEREFSNLKSSITVGIGGYQGRPNVWLRRMAYMLVSRMIIDDDCDYFDDRINNNERRNRGQKGQPNVFQTALMAIFAHAPTTLGARDRERFGKQLMFAYHHYVPAEFLEGFLNQTAAAYAETPTIVVSAMRWWVIEKIAVDDEPSEYRGDYDVEIMDDATKLRKKLDARKVKCGVKRLKKKTKARKKDQWD